jgi:hypothetical protein
MLLRSFCLSLLLLTLISATALADGGFYGSITYDDCDCTYPPDGDKVMIRPVGGGTPYECGINCPRESYNTDGCWPFTFPPGTYEMWVAAKDCYNYWPPKVVVHGEEWQEVNFTVHGPEGTPEGGGD